MQTIASLKNFLNSVTACLIAMACCPQALAQANPAGSAQPAGQFVNHVLNDATGEHKYVVFVPANYSVNKKWPVVMYLHGAFSRGTDGRAQLVSGLAPGIRMRLADFPMMAVFPQCETKSSRAMGGWTDLPDDSDRALRILDQVERDYAVDKGREVLAGMSMGGRGVWHVAAKTPKRWAALVPVSAMATPAETEAVAGIPVWVFHPAKDPFVSIESMKEKVQTLRDKGGRAFLSDVQRSGHDISSVVFTQRSLHDWMLDPSKDPRTDLNWTEPAGYDDGMDQELPFTTGAEISHAIRLRVCNDVLQAMSYAAPAKLEQKPMQGYIAEVRQSTRVGGVLPIDIALSGLYYSGHVEQVTMKTHAPDQLIVQVGLRNVTMTVSNSQVNGRLLLSATAGPVNVVIGHRAPVWLNVAVRPRIENRKLRLDLVGMDFQIPPDNWYVTEPAGVHVRGMPFLNGRFSDGIVDGIYAKKPEIERQVLAALPGMVQKLETQLNDFFSAKTLAWGQGAMPIWQTRVRLWPNDVAIDENGISISLGATMAFLGQPPANFRPRQYNKPSAVAERNIEKGAEIALSEHVIPAWTELISVSDSRHFNVLDVHAKEFHILADREFLQTAIPGLKRLGDDVEINTELQLRKPICFRDPVLADDKRNTFNFSLQSVVLVISTRKMGERDWQPFGEVDMAIDRDFEPMVIASGFAGRGWRFNGTSPFRVTAQWHSAPGNDVDPATVDLDAITSKILEARAAEERLEGDQPIPAKDVVLAGVPLRLEQISWKQHHLGVRLSLPTLMIKNDSTEPLTYEVRGPFSGWGQPRILKPGEHDEYQVPHPLTWRLTNIPSTVYTLPMGRQSSYRITPKPRLVLISEGISNGHH